MAMTARFQKSSTPSHIIFNIIHKYNAAFSLHDVYKFCVTLCWGAPFSVFRGDVSIYFA